MPPQAGEDEEMTRVVLDAIAQSEQRLFDAIARSEAGIHGELASIRQELGEVGRSVKLLVERFFSPSEQRDLRRVG